MFDSLSKFSVLPGETKVFCTHEYTLSNLAFALAVEPDNVDLKKYYEKVSFLRDSNKISLPSNIDLEKNYLKEITVDKRVKKIIKLLN